MSEKSIGFKFTGWKATAAIVVLLSSPFILVAIGIIAGKGSCTP